MESESVMSMVDLGQLEAAPVALTLDGDMVVVHPDSVGDYVAFICLIMDTSNPGQYSSL